MSNQPDSLVLFKYQGKFWQFYLVSTPVIAAWFIASGVIANTIDDVPVSLGSFAIPFFSGTFIIISALARIRFKVTGRLVVQKDCIEILTKHEHLKYLYPIQEEVIFKIRSSNDFMIKYLGRIGGYLKYNHLKFTPNYTEQLDELRISEDRWFVKIRSKSELRKFIEIQQLLQSKGSNVKVI